MDGDRGKSFLGAQNFVCSSSFKIALALTLSTKIHIRFLLIEASLFQNLGTYTYIQLREKKFYNFLHNIHHIYMYIKYIKNKSNKNLFFIFFYYNILTSKFDGNNLAKQFGSFSNWKFLLINKINDFVTTQYDTTIYYPFYLNP